jgi:hypothetical protein
VTLPIHEGKPTVAGVYVAYVNGRPAMTYAERTFLYWDGLRWSYLSSDVSYRDHVYGFVGPLPAMPITD